MDFWDNLDSEITPPELGVPLCLRGDLVASIEDAKSQIHAAIARDKVDADNRGAGELSEAERILARARELEEEARRQSHVFTFRGIGDRAWSDLIAKHPPTKKQRDELDVDHNPETFPTAAVAATLVKVTSPDGTVDERQLTDANVRGLRNRLTLGQWGQLWSGCLRVNTGVVSLGKSGDGTGTLRASGPSSTTAPPEGSPEASSSDGS